MCISSQNQIDFFVTINNIIKKIKNSTVDKVSVTNRIINQLSQQSKTNLKPPSKE